MDYSALPLCAEQVKAAAALDGDCRVITDAAADRCYIYGGLFARQLGLSDMPSLTKETDSSDEDEIYLRMHPEDLVDKRMLEYEFFKFIDTVPPERKLDYRATCRIRIANRDGAYIYAENSTRLLRLSPAGKAWLILCTYSLSANQSSDFGISPRIVDSGEGHVRDLNLSNRRSRLLTTRERQILALIRDGKLSKQIADTLGISINTVNRHRQNILQKLSVANSAEAVAAATMMKLL